MSEYKDEPRPVSTCFDGSPCAELMQKVMSEHGIGSLSAEMMRSLLNSEHEAKDEAQDVGKEEGHESEE
jgi:hypothetical protein